MKLVPEESLERLSYETWGKVGKRVIAIAHEPLTLTEGRIIVSFKGSMEEDYYIFKPKPQEGSSITQFGNIAFGKYTDALAFLGGLVRYKITDYVSLQDLLLCYDLASQDEEGNLTGSIYPDDCTKSLCPLLIEQGFLKPKGAGRVALTGKGLGAALFFDELMQVEES